jgi:thymidylate synthase ThyX
VDYGKESGMRLLQLKKPRIFMTRILDGYGDDSIGELGGAHLACENVSNLASKALENPRIGVLPWKNLQDIFFSIKSSNDYQFYKEPKIMKSELAELYLQANRFLFDTYANLIDPMKKFVMENFPRKKNVPDIAYKFSVRARDHAML